MHDGLSCLLYVNAASQVQARRAASRREPSIVHLPYELRYGAALDTLARHNIDVLAHPTPPSRNNPYKNANVLINACTIGAVPLLSNLPPYDTLGSPEPAVLCDNDPEVWYRALVRLASDRKWCKDVLEHTKKYCADHVSGASNSEVIRGILNRHASPGPWTRLKRYVIAGPWLWRDRLTVQAVGVARRLTQGY